MLRSLSHPATRGFLTAIAMMGCSQLLMNGSLSKYNGARYLVFLIYALGIGWTLLSARKDPSNHGRFGQLFQQGFRHFAVTSLCMVGFTVFVFWKHPEYAKQEAEYQRSLLIETKKYTPAQIDELVIQAEKQYPVRHISATVFGYLMLGAVFTAVGSGLLARKN